MADPQAAEVDRNYDAFQRQLTNLLADHRGMFALMKNGGVVEFFEKPGDAYGRGQQLYRDGIFSIQEVTDEPIDLGFFLHVGH